VGNITIRELVSMPHLKATLVGGAAGADRPISWAQVMDVEAPWDWLDAGDLVLTSGGIIPAEPEPQVAFVTRVAEAGLCGLAIGEPPAGPPISAEMIEAADRHALPLLVSAYDASYVEYVRIVAAANEGAENQALSLIMRIHDEVRMALVAGRSGADVLGALGSVIDCRLELVEPRAWEPMLPGCTAPHAVWREALMDAIEDRGGKMPLVMRLTADDRSALALPVPGERDAALLAFPKVEPGPRLAVLQHVTGACALEMARVDANLERDRRTGAAILAEALDGRVHRALLQAAFVERSLDGPNYCLVIQTSSDDIDRLSRRWAVAGVPYLLTGVEAPYTAVIRGDDSLLDGRDLELMEDPCRIGVSDRFTGAADLPDAARQARWALETTRPGRSELARYGEQSDTFLPRTLSESRHAVDRILGPLVDYDREHETDLLGTLRTYLECDRSPARAAKELFVHKQTVIYRIKRIQELTGRSMRSTPDVSELWFACRALSLRETVPPDPADP
jgi:PucR family transcriptional regulator, purine catabolism regulatory protein